MHIYHVSKQGHNHNDGSEAHPFLTIQRAASIAAAGDRIIVHEGEYREWGRPENGGLHDGCRIVYEAAPGEHVVIKGSEQITGSMTAARTASSAIWAVYSVKSMETRFHALPSNMNSTGMRLPESNSTPPSMYRSTTIIFTIVPLEHGWTGRLRVLGSAAIFTIRTTEIS